MNKKLGERTQRNKKKENNSLSAFSETVTQNKHKLLIKDIIYFSIPFKCKNKTQKDLVTLINEKEIVIAYGPAGTGKSYVTIARALELLKDATSVFTKIIISKPAVEADEKHGFIPGNIREKMEPFISSSLDIFDKLIGKNNRIWLEETGYLEIQPLAYIKGKSIDNTLLIMEEAQNMSPNQMKILLTRIGDNSKFMISGDLDQSDRYQNIHKSGLYDVIDKHKNIEEIGFIEFNESEIVRNKLIGKILNNYRKPILDIADPEPHIPKTKKIPWYKNFFNLRK